MSGFYIGYLPKAPADLSTFIRRIVFALLIVGALAGVVLVVAQQKFSPAVFEWQQERDFSGVIEEKPYPSLLVRRPGVTQPGEEYSRYLLLAIGKHGAQTQAMGLDGQTVRLRGKLIYREGQTLIEVMPGTMAKLEETVRPVRAGTDGGSSIVIRGEIVDSKCYAGVMNPGRGKVHRDCAVRCISGGIPPALLTRNADGSSRVYLLASNSGGPLEPKTILDRVGEPVRVAGILVEEGDTASIRVSSIERD